MCSGPGCTGEEKSTARNFMPCECCLRNDPNDGAKKNVTYCAFCGAYICAECWGSLERRTIAFGDKLIEKVVEVKDKVVAFITGEKKAPEQENQEETPEV